MNTFYIFIISLVTLASHAANASTSGISGDSLVQVKGKGSVFMKNVELGDHVLISGNTNHQEYEPINSFAPSDSSAPAEYLQIITSTARLEVTKDHMIYLIEGGRAVPASSLQVRDQLSTAGIKNQFSAIKAIRTIVRDGKYAPVTLSGTIVVNGIRTSISSSSTLSISTSISTVPRIGSISATKSAITWSEIVAKFLHRIWCSFFVSCNVDGDSSLTEASSSCSSHQLLQWLNEQGASIQFILYAPLVAIVTFLTTLETLATYALPAVFLVLLLGTVPLSFRIKRVAK